MTWTVNEGHALSRVLTPGKDSHNDYVPYTHNYAIVSKKMRNGCPAKELKRLGAFWTTTGNCRRQTQGSQKSSSSRRAACHPPW